MIAAFVALAVGGVAYATIPDGNGVIHGCYTTMLNQGQLRVIDTDKGQACKPGEQALDWGQTGAQGPSGPSGPSGPAGTAGPTSITPGGGFVDDSVTLLSKTIGPTEAGLTIMTAHVTLTDLSGTSGGATIVSCFVTKNGGGPGFFMGIQDNGEANADRADREFAAFAVRDTLAENDVVGIRCSAGNQSDQNETQAQGQLVLERVNS